MTKILLIDDDADFSDFLQQSLQEKGYRVTCLERAESGPQILIEEEYALVLLDYRMPGMSGMEFLDALQREGVGVPVILMTGHGTSDTVIQAMNRGAFDYVEKPLELEDLLRELEPMIEAALRLAKPIAPIVVPGEEPASETSTGPGLLGKSKGMLEVYKLIGRVAKSDEAVLVLGETGTGKELVARAIHTNSLRQGRPFVAINCTALNENLLDDELFGHEPHSYTGAEKLRKGRFEYADGGTLFLDEVGDMPPGLQAKLLRVLETGEVSRIGSNEVIQVDVRILSATHRDLERAVRDERFREDFYYRLSGVTVQLPPLRERGADLKELAEHFLRHAATGAGQSVPTLDQACWDKLAAYGWPGNVRELKNVLRGGVLVCRGMRIMPDDLKLQAEAPSSVGEDVVLTHLREAVQSAWESGRDELWSLLREMLERELLKFALAKLDGNQTHVAERLGMARNTVNHAKRKHGLD